MRSKLFSAALALALLAVVTIASRADAQEAGGFAPTFTLTAEDNAPEASSNYTVDFGLKPYELNFGGVVAFVPEDWGIVKGDEIPVGTLVGQLTALATLGLINGPCNTQLQVRFDFMNASLDRSDTVIFDDSDKDDVFAEGYGTDDFAEDKDGDGLLDAINKYPEFIDRVVGPIQPIRRAAAITPVAGIPVLLQFLVFEPGTEFDLVSDDLEQRIPTDPALGYPTFVFLQNAGDPQIDPEPGPITDFCTPLTSTNITFGLGADNRDITQDDPFVGEPLNVNPQNGKYTFTIFSVSQRDADGDAIQNSMDTCPYEANVGDSTLPGDGDVDQDGVDAACDPDDNKLISDEDLDGYLNRQDNCPLEPNGQEQTDPETGNQEDTDLDQIGNACDTNPDTADGELIESTNEVEITIGDGTGAGGPPTNCPTCFVLGEGGDEPEETDAPDEVADSGDDGGSNTGLIIGIIAAVAAGVVVLGGGAFLLMRRS